MQQLLQSIWVSAGNKTVVFVTHDVHEALMLGTRVVLMARHLRRLLRGTEEPSGAEVLPLRPPPEPGHARHARR